MRKIYGTDRLILKTFTNSFKEAQAVLNFYERNREFFKPWEPLRDEEFYKLENRRDILSWELNSMRRKESIRLWIFDKNDTKFEDIMGMVSLTNIIRGAFQSCFLGYAMDKDAINKGYATEAIGKAIEIGFNELNLHRIEANIMPKNKASLRVAEKLGLQNEGLAKNYLKINGEWEDHIHMVILNEKME
ncbi:GNAT family N-acetyltransferase [Sporosalibacterium faouarense]|uniref:GNAT family N-acetyltransferase n=1 Tax=Sporosalibacterium faouarense TaxID=516123 RepID=UPI00141CDD0C|nr:GNAT family N-acetyltransferase [Bacillota bacterium]